MLLIILLNSRCRNKCKEPVPSAKFSPLLEKYFANIKPNNFWIFKKTSDNKTDSFFVSRFKEERLIISEKNLSLVGSNTCEEELTVGLKLSPDTLQSKLAVNLTLGVGTRINSILLTTVNNIGQVGGIGFTGSTNIDGTTNKLLIKDSITILNKTFKDVLIMKELDGGEVIFAPNIGIIRFVLTIPLKDTFNLEKFKIL